MALQVYVSWLKYMLLQNRALSGVILAFETKVPRLHRVYRDRFMLYGRATTPLVLATVGPLDLAEPSYIKQIL